MEKSEVLLAVVRVRGKINLSPDVKKTFELLNLNNKNWCIVLKSSPSNIGMLKKVKDYITWGEISKETLNDLYKKRGENRALTVALFLCVQRYWRDVQLGS